MAPGREGAGAGGEEVSASPGREEEAEVSIPLLDGAIPGSPLHVPFSQCLADSHS